MSSANVTAALLSLRTAADAARYGFPTTTWRKETGPGPDEYSLAPQGHFKGLALENGLDLIIACELHVPADAHAFLLAGEPLEATLDSLYPVDLSHDGRLMFQDETAPVACGPALFTILPALARGANGTLRLRVYAPKYQTNNWVRLRMTTPSLRMRFEELDIAWSQLFLADAVAATVDERATVDHAAEAVGVNCRVDHLGEMLSPLAEKIAAIDVHLIGHSHIDMNWLWTWADTVRVILRDIGSVLALMDEFPELTFSHSQPATYEVIRQHEPAMFATILAHLRSGRWEATTMQWVEPDCNMPAGEAHARQLLEGVRYSREVLGISPTVFHSPDTFGHAGNLPQLAVSAGAKYYYHHRANPGQAKLWPAYWWEGQNGNRLFAFSTFSYNGEIIASDIARAAVRAHAAGQPAGMHFHGIGDHGGGPSRHNLQTLRRLQRTPGLPRSICSTMSAYAEQIIASGVSLPVHRGESSTLFEGCYTTHADTKFYNRSGENLLLSAETLATLACLSFPAELADAWRKVLFNQFHDILDGSAIHESYAEHAQDYEAVKASAGKITVAALDVMESAVPAGQIAVTNPLGFSRTDVVSVAAVCGEGAVWLESSTGHRTLGQFGDSGLVFVANVPAFGTVSYARREPAVSLENPLRVAPAFSSNDNRQDNLLGDAAKDAPYLRVDTQHFAAYVRRDNGVIVSLFDKRTNKDLVSFGLRRGSDYLDTARPDLALNVLQLLDEYPHGMSAWQMHEVRSEQSLIRGATTRIVESGPVRCVLEVTHAVRQSTIVQRIIFYANLPRIDFETRIDWKEPGSKEVGVPNLKVAFTARLDDCQAWFETPFAAVNRPADGQETPALRWADVGGSDYGIAVLNDSKYGYDALGCRLRLSLLRSAYEPDSISDIGVHHVRYSLVPHAGDWRAAGIVQQAAGFNQPVLARLAAPTGDASSRKKAAVWRPVMDGEGVQIAAVKLAADRSGVVIRLYESVGRATQVRLSNLPADAKAWSMNVVEDRGDELPVAQQAIALKFMPWQVQTVCVQWSEHP